MTVDMARPIATHRLEEKSYCFATSMGTDAKYSVPYLTVAPGYDEAVFLGSLRRLPPQLARLAAPAPSASDKS